MLKVNETVLEINLKALEHNYRFLKSKLLYTTKFIAVVKAFAYGSDTIVVAKKLEQLGVDYLAVAYIHEGVALRKAAIKTPIIVLHPQTVHFKLLFDFNLEPSLYSQKILAAFLILANKHKKTNYPVHLKFNTGLNRLGFMESELSYISEQLTNTNAVKIISALSHLVASEDKNEAEFTQQQIKQFERIAALLTHKIGYAPLKHILNTSGIINYPESQFDMVRSGIGLYGFSNDKTVDNQLKPIATLKTIISQIHKIAEGGSVGYNRAYTTVKPKVTATLPLGHADGISRQYGNEKAYVTVNGHKAPIIGNICMDMIMIDISKIDCKEGDEVVIFGGNASAEHFAEQVNTISYELLTAISQRVKRTIIKE